MKVVEHDTQDASMVYRDLPWTRDSPSLTISIREGFESE